MAAAPKLVRLEVVEGEDVRLQEACRALSDRFDTGWFRHHPLVLILLEVLENGEAVCEAADADRLLFFVGQEGFGGSLSIGSCPEEDLAEWARCQNCDLLQRKANLYEIEDLALRVSPGEVMPVGECQACGAVAHLIAC